MGPKVDAMAHTTLAKHADMFGYVSEDLVEFTFGHT